MAQPQPKNRRPDTRLLALLLILVGLGGLAGGFFLYRDQFSAGESAAAGAVKIRVSEEGIFEVTEADLKRLGWGDAAPDDLRLEHLGEPYPFWIDENRDTYRLLFYGRPPAGLTGHYTAQNAYFLYRDGDADRQRYWQEPDEPDPVEIAAGENYFTHTIRLEQDLHYQPLSEENHTWYTVQMIAPTTWSADFELDAPASGPGTLQADFFGVTESPAENPDHHVRITLNGTLVLDEAWDGRGSVRQSASIDAPLLAQGSNTIVVESAGDTGVLADIILLDSIEIRYQRPADLPDQPFFFTAPGGALQLSVLKDQSILLDVETPEDARILFLDSRDENGGPIPTQAGHRYASAGPGAYSDPDAIEPAFLEPDLRADTTGADYIAIGPSELLTALEPLLDHRESQGLSTLAAPWEAVRDQFGAGMETPDAIRNFLVYASQKWDRAPRFLLLVGDWTHDPRENLGESGFNLLPSSFRFTHYGGETVSDVAIARLDDDIWPDIAVGRVPADTPEQAAIFVEKTLAYEQTAFDGWERRLLAIADGQEASFEGDAERFLDQFPDPYEGILLTPEAGSQDAHLAIEDELKRGVLMMSYFGHGSITQWGKDSLFTVEDGAALSNAGRLPVMINITCLAGLFTHPRVESLSEVMLWNPSGGAVAALGATSLTLPSEQAFLTRAFAESLLENPEGRLGEILLAAQRRLPENPSPGVLEVLDTFLLFGDPALVLPAPEP